MARGGEAPGVPELGQHGGRHTRPDPRVLHEGAAARLAAGEGAKLAVERGDVHVDLLDHGEGHVDLAASRGREVELSQALLCITAGEAAGARDAVVKEDRVGPRSYSGSPSTSAATPSRRS